MKTRQPLQQPQRTAHRRGMASVLVIAILAIVAILLMGSGRMVRQMREEVDLTERLQLRRLEASTGHLPGTAIPTPATAVESEFPRYFDWHTPAVRPAETNVMALVEWLVKEPSLDLMMSDAPTLDATTEATLIDRCRQLPAPSQRLGLICLLAYRGGEQSVAFLTNMVCHEYAGRPIARRDEGTMGMIPELLGFLARKSTEAFLFLQQGRDPLFWESCTLWEVQPNGVFLSPGTTESNLAYHSFRGLAWSARPEVDDLLDDYFEHPEQAVEDHASDGVLDGAYIRHLLRDLELEEATRLAFTDYGAYLSGYSDWRRDGKQRWSAWGDETFAMRKRQAQGGNDRNRSPSEDTPPLSGNAHP
ncbi:MAG: hypothetical protein H7A46_01145 [Verrucomicrobiales bacterium]|nr:hypothetical protein [Verrucomicrobiales bacterium]